MKIIAKAQQQGHILLVILIAMVLMGVTLGSYLNLVSNQNISVMRSQAWNEAIAVAEAGIEEAMAHLNYNVNNLTKDGWTVEGTNVVKERTWGTSKYKVAISKDIDPPFITSSAQVLIPMKNEYIKARTVRVTTTNDALFAKGMVAKGNIQLNGNNIKTDSFDSTDPNYSTGGMYDPAKSKDNGDVATNSTLDDSLNTWNADIMGKASTGPGGTVKIGPNGTVGSKSWHNAGKKGIEPGWSSDDMNISIPDVQRPWAGSEWAPTSGTIGGTNYSYVLNGGNFELSNLSMSGNQVLVVTAPSVLLVTSSIGISGNAKIVIAPGASLQLYMEGDSTSFGGNGVANQTGSAANFGYWGLPSNTSVSLKGNAAFVGTIYAPQAAFTLGGGGKDTYDFVGASISDTVSMNGHFNFHYDEALKKLGPRRGYIITSWNESGWNEI